MRVEINRRRGDLEQAISRQLTLLRAHQTTATSRLTAFNPLGTLQRGYAIVSDSDGEVVTAATTLGDDQALSIQFADGNVEARTTSLPNLS